MRVDCRAGNQTGVDHALETAGVEQQRTRKGAPPVRRDQRHGLSQTQSPVAISTVGSTNVTSALPMNYTCWPSLRSRHVQPRSLCGRASRTPPAAAQTGPGRRRWQRFVWLFSFRQMALAASIFYIPMMLGGCDFRCDHGHISSWRNSRYSSMA